MHSPPDDLNGVHFDPSQQDIELCERQHDLWKYARHTVLYGVAVAVLAKSVESLTGFTWHYLSSHLSITVAWVW